MLHGLDRADEMRNLDGRTELTMRHLISAIAFFFAAVFINPVFAAQVTFDFANLKSGPVGFLPDGTMGTDYFGCTGNDLCSSNVNGNVLGGSLFYETGGIGVEASATYNGGTASVVQDHDNSYNGLLSGSTAIGAGLGVYHKVNPTDNSDDNITGGEMLMLSFGQVVTLNTLGLRSEGHNTTNWAANSGFEYSTDGTSWTAALFPYNSGLFALNLTSYDFYFRYLVVDEANPGVIKADQFYVSSVTVTPVPEPETYAMLVAGLGLMGFVARRRRQTGAAA